MKILSKVNVTNIVASHFKTIQNDNSKKPDFDDMFTFVVLPVMVASALVYFKIVLVEKAINIIITSLSIFVGLLFNVIVLIFDIISRDASEQIKNRLLKELLSNISFAILTSIVTIIFTFFAYFSNFKVQLVVGWIVYFLLTEFALVLFMVLKRMYVIFTNEIDQISKGEKA